MNGAPRSERSHHCGGAIEKPGLHDRAGVGHRMNHRKGLAIDCHVPNLSPMEMPRPRAHSVARMRVLPEGCTSRTQIEESLHATNISSRMSITSPGSPTRKGSLDSPGI